MTTPLTRSALILAALSLLVAMVIVEAGPASAQLSNQACRNYDPGAYCNGDVNCDNVVNVTDALIIAQYSVSTRTVVTSCAEFRANFATTIVGDFINTSGALQGDLRTDGTLNVTDALHASQCSVGTAPATVDCDAKSPV